MIFTNLSSLSKPNLKTLSDWGPAAGATGVDLVHPVSLIRCEAKIVDLDRVAKLHAGHRRSAQRAPWLIEVSP